MEKLRGPKSKLTPITPLPFAKKKVELPNRVTPQPLFKKILIANRGEIAVRVIRACKELGISTVAVYSEADRGSLHARMADESVCIGPAPAVSSYLDMTKILAAAELTGAEAIHPGYGFLSENADFAHACKSSGFAFIGPTEENIRLMGEKTQARRLAVLARVPLLPGSVSAVPHLEAAQKEAAKIGFPIMLKAAAGGGGRGIHVIQSASALESQWAVASQEALAAFKDGALYIERYCPSPRHIEVQVLCDAHGKRVVLGDRDCSVQRRHQKLVEEAPAPGLAPELRQAMAAAALRLCEQVQYLGAGTVEFLVQDGLFYFMEMNTRIQVEHTVTEMVTGVDLIQEQIRIACGEPLSFDLEQIEIRGHAIECRINAEDPDTFVPWPGVIHGYLPAGGFGVRVDSFVSDGFQVPQHYDSLIAKLVVHAPSRAAAIRKMRQALDEFQIGGIRTNLEFHKKVMHHPQFEEGRVDTHFIEVFRPVSE